MFKISKKNKKMSVSRPTISSSQTPNEAQTNHLVYVTNYILHTETVQFL